MRNNIAAAVAVLGFALFALSLVQVGLRILDPGAGNLKLWLACGAIGAAVAGIATAIVRTKQTR